MPFLNPLSAAGPIARSTWSTLMGTSIPKWVYPAFAGVAAAPVAGYELDQMRRLKEQRKRQELTTKAAVAMATELGTPPGSVGNLMRLNQLGNMKARAKYRSNLPGNNKPTAAFRQDADTVSSGSGDEGQGAGVALPNNEFATN